MCASSRHRSNQCWPPAAQSEPGWCVRRIGDELTTKSAQIGLKQSWTDTSTRAQIRTEKGTAMRVMRAALITIGIIQILVGATLLVRPATLQTLLHLQPAAPAWVNYILAMSAARIIGYGVGMFVAAGAPWRHRDWINTMIAIQAVDFIATAAYLANGVLQLGHVAAGLLLPWLWIAVLRWAPPRAPTAPPRISPSESSSPTRHL